MKVFISWSGEKSHNYAKALRDWLPGVINAIEPWLSSSDIEPGSRWGFDLSTNLENTDFGIICLTQENIKRTWINFEAGALSKKITTAKITPILINLPPSNVKGPLAQFQCIEAKKDGFLKVVISLNKAIKMQGETFLEQSKLHETFNVWWPTLEKMVSKISTKNKVSPRTTDDILSEILQLMRNMTIEQRISKEKEPLLKDVLDPNLINDILIALYQRVNLLNMKSGMKSPPPPPTITNDDLNDSSGDIIRSLLMLYTYYITQE